MKKNIYLFVIAFMCVLASCTDNYIDNHQEKVDNDISTYTQLQEKKVAWDYPIKPGTAEWYSMESHDEMLNVCQIPDNILKIITTTDLITICLNYPLQFDFYAYNNLLEGVRAVATNFNGLRELLMREDNVRCLLEELKIRDMQTLSNRSQSVTEYGELIVKQSLIETLLSHELILSNATLEQQKEIADLAIKNMNIKEQMPQTYSRYSLGSSAYLLCASLKKANSNIFFTPTLELFFRSGTLQNAAVINELKQFF